VLSGRDLLGAAQTGTGKTAGFTLPLLQRLATGAHTSTSPARHPVRALILVPTRELAAQVQESVRAYGRHLKVRSTVIFGGVGFNPQAMELRRGVDIVVATPGRLLDHVEQRTIDLRQVEVLVLDEADRMLDMGFIPAIRRILALLPAKRQNLLFSATFPDEIRKLAGTFMRDPATVEVAPRNRPIELISQVAHPVDQGRKRELLAHLVKAGDWHQVLVFTRTKHGANRLAQQLEREGIEADAIHGNKSQPARTRALKRFKDNELRVLVATDIASRGLDIEELPHVVNYDLPHVAEDYVHRIGRTGRAGLSGEAVSLVCVDEHDFLRDIERLLKRDIPKVVIPGFEPNLSIKAEPISHGRGQRGGGRPQASRQGGDHRRGQRSPSASHARADGQRSHSNPHARDGAQRPQSHSHARTGAQRPHSNPHPRAASQHPHAQPHARSAAEDHDNSHAPRAEVDGNRRTSENTGNQQRRLDRYDAPQRSHQPATHSIPVVTKKPAHRHAKREVPALFEGGSKRED